MNQVLTQAEIDALLNTLSDGEAPAPGSSKSESASIGAPSAENFGERGIEAGDIGGLDPGSSGPEITPYDLTNQDRVIRGRFPTLDIIHERFIRLFRMSMSNSLRKIATISIVSSDFLKFGEFVNTLPIPSCMCLMRLDGLRGMALLVFESKLAYALVDSYFGGTDRTFNKLEGKEFTRIELSIMRQVMDLAMKDLEEAWSPIHRINISYLRTEVNPQFVGVVAPSEVVIATTFEVELQSASGALTIVFPYSTLEPIKSKLNATFQSESDRSEGEWSGKIEEHIVNAEANLLVNLGETTITVGDLVNLNVGDIIPLNQDADGELDLLIESVKKFKCFFGVSRGNRAVQVTRMIENE